MTKIAIIGSRRRANNNDFKVTVRAFFDICAKINAKEKDAFGGITLVSGGCKVGGDRFMEMIAHQLNIPQIIHLPNTNDLDQDLLKKNAKAAYAKINYARNVLVANDAQYMIALVAQDRKGGTEHTIKCFLKKINLTEQEAIKKGLLVLL